MSDKPKAGEWWEDNEGVRVYVVGFRVGGDMVCQYECGTVGILLFSQKWKRLDGCNGFDWEPDRSNSGLLAALVNLRDNMDRLNRRVVKLEQVAIMNQVIGAGE